MIHFIPLSTQKMKPGGAAAMGNFDGVHLGHQALLQALRALPGPRGVILFEPHPKERFCTPAEAPRRIFLLADKLKVLQEMGLDYVLLIHFSQTFSQWTPEQFIHTILHNKLGLKALVVGPDFRFGCQRQGAREDIEKAGIFVHQVPFLIADQERVSSTLIRASLLQGNFKQVQQLLGHGYTVTGKVLHGLKRGRTLGFPTLNMGLRPNMLLAGVYAVKIKGLGDAILYGVANVGRRPSLNPLVHPLLEVHIFDYHQEVYGQRVSIEFIAKLRDEKKFASLPELVVQIAQDVIHAKQELKCPIR